MAEKLAIPTRDELIRRYERDYLLRNEQALVGPKTVPGLDARLLADQTLPLYAEASRQADTIALENRSGDDLDQELFDLGLPDRLPAVGSTGTVAISAATGGAPMRAGLECKDTQSGLRFRCLVTGTRFDGDAVPIAAIDTGPDTNVKAGSLLTWTSPPAGLGPKCTVLVQSDGVTGLSNGREVESDPEVRLRIQDSLAHPAVAGNEADYRRAALSATTVSPQAAFVYPCSNSSGTTSVCFTIRPTTPGAGRIPNDAQVAEVRSNIIGQMPKDDALFMPQMVADPVRLVLLVRWRKGTVFWEDSVIWPPYYADNNFVITSSPTPTATVFAVATSNGSPAVAPTSPQVGQTIAVFDKGAKTFRQKRVLSVSGSNPWTITCDTTLSASDTTYAPVAGQYVGPWSEGLQALLPGVIAYFDGLGPGEMVEAFYDAAGARQKRFPSPDDEYPSVLSGQVLTPLYALGQVGAVQVAAPTLPYATAVGAPGTIVRIIQLDELVVYPL